MAVQLASSGDNKMACIYCGSEKIHVHDKVNMSRLLWHSPFDLKELQVTCLSCGKSFKPGEKPKKPLLLDPWIWAIVVVFALIKAFLWIIGFEADSMP